MNRIDPKHLTVSNGIRLATVQTDKFKAGAITFSLAAPVSARSVVFSSVLCGVLKRSNQKYPSVSSVYKRLDELYASSLDIRTFFNSSELSLSISSELLDNAYAPCGTDILGGMIDMISQALLFPVTDRNQFPHETVAREVITVKNALLAESNNTQAYAAIRLKELLNRNNPNYPTIEAMLGELNEITPKTLWDFYIDLISVSSIDVFYVGSSDAEAVADRIRVCFNSFSSECSFSASAKLPDPALPFAERREQRPVSQSKLAMGFHTNANVAMGNYHSALVFNELFGASPTSKLFMNVREKMGLCYYCASSYNTFSGTINVSSGIDASKKDITAEAVLSQLEDIKTGSISDSELEASKKSLINAYRQSYDNPFDISNFYSSRARLGITESIDECIDAIASVKLDDIIGIARSAVYDTAVFIEGTGSQNAEEEQYE